MGCVLVCVGGCVGCGLWGVAYGWVVGGWYGGCVLRAMWDFGEVEVEEVRWGEPGVWLVGYGL